MAEAWAEHYRGLLADITGRAAARHGYAPRAVEAAEARLGVRLPGPLRGYYLAAGRHPINQAHNRLWPPDALEVERGRVVFLEENQGVVYWAVPARGRAADPMVFQAEDPEDGPWRAEARCSTFLSVMLCWQAVAGGLRAVGLAEPVRPEARRALRGWQSVGKFGGLAAFVRHGRVVCAQEDGEAAMLYLGARSRRDLGALGAELGVTVEET